jgi:hypothetical protein
VIALTSIAPDPARVPAQRAYLDTWRAAGLVPVSLNHPSEVAALTDAYPGVEVVATEATAEVPFGRPYVRLNAFFEWIARHGTALVINADLRVQATPGQIEGLAALAAAGMPYLLQYNCTSPGVQVIEPCGISAFAVHPRLVPLYDSTFLCLGKPWWDYWVPYVALKAGVPLYCPTQILCYHAQHARSGWSEADWLACALELGRLTHTAVEPTMAGASRYSAAVYGAITASTKVVALP